jgi:hypothetical protein
MQNPACDEWTCTASHRTECTPGCCTRPMLRTLSTHLDAADPKVDHLRHLHLDHLLRRIRDDRMEAVIAVRLPVRQGIVCFYGGHDLFPLGLHREGHDGGGAARDGAAGASGPVVGGSGVGCGLADVDVGVDAAGLVE